MRITILRDITLKRMIMMMMIKGTIKPLNRTPEGVLATAAAYNR